MGIDDRHKAHRTEGNLRRKLGEEEVEEEEQEEEDGFQNQVFFPRRHCLKFATFTVTREIERDREKLRERNKERRNGEKHTHKI